jgi:N-acetylglucosaminyltransferase
MKITIIIPAHNEERSIKRTVESCINQTRPADQILVVNDGSTDKTGEILATFGDKIQVVTIPIATGNKSYAQEHGLKFVDGDVFIATDADTIMDSHFVEKVLPHFEDKSVHAVAGYVKSIKNNWLTACREIDYVIGQDLHKVAQANMNFLFVIPGCAGAFRTNSFKTLIDFEHDTLTEDLDFTYKMHTEYSNIVFEKNAYVYTQDPFTLYSYINQIRRWYSGGWQNLKKHLPKVINRPLVAMELSLMYIEGIIFSLLLFVLPFLSLKYFAFYLISNLAFVILISSYAAIKRGRLDLLLYSPLYLILVFVNAVIFLEQFTSEIVMGRKLDTWFKPERTKETLTP